MLSAAVIFIPALIPWIEMQSIIFSALFFSVVVVFCISYCAFALMCIMELLWFFCLSFCSTILESLLKSFMRNIKIFSQETTCHLLLFFLLRIFPFIFHGNKMAREKQFSNKIKNPMNWINCNSVDGSISFFSLIKHKPISKSEIFSGQTSKICIN